MAVVTKVRQTVKGNERETLYEWEAEGTAESVALGVGNIIGAVVTPKSVATSKSPVVNYNEGDSGTSIVGNLAMSNTVSADVFNVVVYHGS